MDLSPLFGLAGVEQLHRDRSRQIQAITHPATPPPNDASAAGEAAKYALAHHALEGAELAARTRDAARFDWYAAHPDTGAGQLTMTSVAGPRIILSPDLDALPRSEISETPYYVIGPDTQAAPANLQDIARSAYVTASRCDFGDLLTAHAVVVCLLRRKTLDETLDSWTITRLPGTVFCDHVGDDVVLARDLIHEASHNWLNDALTATKSKLDDQAEFFSPWKQTIRPAFGYLHSCWAFPLIMIYTARVIGGTSGDLRRFLGTYLARQRDLLAATARDHDKALTLIKDADLSERLHLVHCEALHL